MNKFKVLIIDNQPIFTLGLVHILSDIENITLSVKETCSGQAVLERIEMYNPDIVIMEAGLPAYDGIQVTEILRETHPKIKVILFTSDQQAEITIYSAINAGAKGFIPNTASPAEVVKGVLEINAGGIAIHPTMMPLLLERLVKKGHKKPKAEIPLSAREKEVIELVAEGKSNQEIADILFISSNTVKGHLKRIIGKLNINNRVELARYALQNGLSGENDNYKSQASYTWHEVTQPQISLKVR